jgi:uncharacterized protein (DUF58 family)
MVFGLATYVSGRAFGARALDQLGFALIALPLIAVAVVRMGRHELKVERTVSPERARAQQKVNVKLRVENHGRGSAPLLLAEDTLPLKLSGHPRFAIHGIEAGGHRDISFVVRPTQRGRYDIGPLRIDIVDPFSLAKIRSPDAARSTFLVYPSSEKLRLPRDLGERRSATTSAMRQPTGPRGEDFYTIREYGQGDDLRKIHWPSTAKRGRYMIRQEETPWHTRATVVIDDRWAAHDGYGDGSSFERAVEVSASMVELYGHSGYSYRLVPAHRDPMPASRGSDHFHRCMDLLATITTKGPRAESDPALSMRFAELETQSMAEETLVVVSGSIDERDARSLVRCARLYKQAFVVLLPGHRFSTQATRDRWEGERQILEVSRLLARTGIRTIVLGPGEPLAPPWLALSYGGQRGGDPAWARKPELA